MQNKLPPQSRISNATDWDIMENYVPDDGSAGSAGGDLRFPMLLSRRRSSLEHKNAWWDPRGRSSQGAGPSSTTRRYVVGNQRLRDELAGMQQMQAEWQFGVGAEVNEFLRIREKQPIMRREYCSRRDGR